MPETHHRTRKCGAVYNRSESMAPNRQISSFECKDLRNDNGNLEYGMGAVFSPDRGPGKAARELELARHGRSALAGYMHLGERRRAVASPVTDDDDVSCHVAQCDKS